MSTELEVKEKVNPVSRDRETINVGRVEFRPYVLSKGEKLVCEVWARTKSYKACIEALKAKYNRNITKAGIEKWMRYRSAVQEYILKLEGWEGEKMSEGEWEAGVAGAARGDKRLNKTTPAMYKLYACLLYTSDAADE